MIEERLLSFWSLEGGEQGVGNASLLNQPLTAELATRRNDWVAEHAARIVVAYASPEGNLMCQAMQWNVTDDMLIFSW